MGKTIYYKDLSADQLKKLARDCLQAIKHYGQKLTVETVELKELLKIADQIKSNAVIMSEADCEYRELMRRSRSLCHHSTESGLDR